MFFVVLQVLKEKKNLRSTCQGKIKINKYKFLYFRDLGELHITDSFNEPHGRNESLCYEETIKQPKVKTKHKNRK